MQAKKAKKLGLVLGLSLGGLTYLLSLAFFIYCGTYYGAEPKAIALCENEDSHGDIIFASSSTPKAGFIFYPGAKVDERAYAPLAKDLSDQGVYTVIAKMPFHLAFFDPGAMGRIAAENPKVSAWYLGGHSLGGAMAASYLYDHLEAYRGLALLGSYSTVDLTASSAFKTATIYGSEDQVLNRSNYQENLKNLPANNVETVIAGGNHGQFGDYGVQPGDGQASISPLKQQEETAAAILELIAR